MPPKQATKVIPALPISASSNNNNNNNNNNTKGRTANSTSKQRQSSSSPQQKNKLRTSSGGASAGAGTNNQNITPREGDRLWEREKQNLLRMSSEQLMRNALKMHFEILDLRSGAALLSEQTNLLSDQLTNYDANSMIAPDEFVSGQRLRSLETQSHNEGGGVSPEKLTQQITAKLKKQLSGDVEDVIKQLNSLQRAIEGGLSVIGPVSPRRMPLLQQDPALNLPEDAPSEQRLDNTVIQLSQAVHHLLAQAFVLAEAVGDAQAALQSSPGRAAEYLALRAAVSAGEKEIEVENSRSSRLQKQLDAMDETVKCLKATRGDLEETCNISIHSLQAQQEKLQQQNSDLSIKLRNTELERDRAREEIDRWKKEFSDLQEQHDEVEREKAKYYSENNMNKLLYEQSKADIEGLLNSMNDSSDQTVAAVHHLRGQLNAANEQNERYRQQLAELQSEGPLCTEAMLIRQVELQDAEVVEMEDRLDLQLEYFQRWMDMRLRFQRNMMQLALNESITKAAMLQNELNDLESQRDADLENANERSEASVKKLQSKHMALVANATLSEREEIRRQEILLNEDGELFVTLRVLSLSALRDLDASYVTVANQNDKMEKMQERIETLEYDKHDTKELKGMLDTAQKAFHTADSEAGKLLQYLSQAREEIARLNDENKKVVEESNDKLQEMEDKMNQAVADEQKASSRTQELETCMEELEKKLSEMIEALEEKLKESLSEKERLEKQLAEALEKDEKNVDIMQSMENFTRQQLEEVALSPDFYSSQLNLCRDMEDHIKMIAALVEMEGEHSALKKEHASLKQQLEDKDQMIKEMDDEIKNRASSSQQEFDDMKKMNEELEEELKKRGAASQEELDQLKNSNKKLEEELKLRGAASQEELDQLKNNNKKLEEDLEKIRNDFKTSQASQTELEEEVEKLKSDLKQSQALNKQLEEEVENIKQQLAKSEDNARSLKQEVQKFEEELLTRADASEGDFKKLQAEIKEKTRESEKLKTYLEEKEKEIENLKKQIEETNQQLADQKAALEESNKQNEKMKKQLEGDSQSLQQQIADKDSEIEQLQKDLEESKKQVAELKKQISDKEDEVLNHRQLSARSGAEHQQKISGLESSLEDAEHKIKMLETALEAKKKALTESDEKLEQTTEELDKIRDERDRLQKQLDQTKNAASSTESEKQTKIDELEKQLQQLKKQLAQEQQESEDREKKLSEEKTKLQQQLNQEKANAAALRDNANANESDSKRALSDLQCKQIELQTELDQASGERDSLKNKNAGLTKELEEQKQVNTDLTAHNEKLTAQLAKVTASRDRLKAALKDAVALQDQLSKIAEIQDANQKLAFDNARLGEQLDALRAASADAEKQVMLSKSEYTKLEEAIATAVLGEEELSKALDSTSTNSNKNNSNEQQQSSGGSRSTSQTNNNSPHHESINKIASTMSAAVAGLKQSQTNGEATCASIQGLMKLLDTLHHQLSLPQPMLMAPTPANTARGVDSVNSIFPPLMGRLRELIFKASQAGNNSNNSNPAWDPVEKILLMEESERNALLAEQSFEFNEFLEDVVGDIEEKAIQEGAKVRRAMELLEEAQFAMRGRVGSEKLIGALDLLKATPGARRGAGLAALQGRARRGGTVILNINEIDPKYRSIAWLVSTRGSLVDHLGDIFRSLFAIPFQIDKTQRMFGTALGTFLTQIEKMHIGLPPYLLNMDVVKVREATDKELARILVHSSSASSHPSAADSPECSPVRVLHDGVDRSSLSPQNYHNSSATNMSVGRETHDASTGTTEELLRPSTPPARTVVNNWKSPPPPPAFNTFY